MHDIIDVGDEHEDDPKGQLLHVKVIDSRYVPLEQDEHFFIWFTTEHDMQRSPHNKQLEDVLFM